MLKKTFVFSRTDFATNGQAQTELLCFFAKFFSQVNISRRVCEILVLLCYNECPAHDKSLAAWASMYRVLIGVQRAVSMLLVHHLWTHRTHHPGADRLLSCQKGRTAVRS